MGMMDILPKLLVDEHGNQLEKQEQWEKRRSFICNILEESMYGKMPKAPENVAGELVRSSEFLNGAGSFEHWRLSFGPGQRVSMNVYVMRPSKGKKVIPIVMAGSFLEKEIAEFVVRENFAVIACDFSEAVPDGPEYVDAPLAKEYPDYSWKVIAMWGWLMSRALDWLETVAWADVKKAVFTGHSRYGKAALCAGIFDERAAVVAPAGSGCGGMGSLRVCGGRLGENTGVCETLGFMMMNLGHWLRPELADYGKPEPNGHAREMELPFDANFIGAAIAPRPLMILEGLDDTWSNPYGTYVTWANVHEVYEFLEKPQACAIHFREGGHEYNLEDWSVLIDFCKVNLLGMDKKTNYSTLPPARTPEEDRARFFAQAQKKIDRWLFDSI